MDQSNMTYNIQPVKIQYTVYMHVKVNILPWYLGDRERDPLHKFHAFSIAMYFYKLCITPLSSYFNLCTDHLMESFQYLKGF